jgi:hypothetical protein
MSVGTLIETFNIFGHLVQPLIRLIVAIHLSYSILSPKLI